MAEETFWYFATPYTKYPGGIAEAARLAAVNAAKLYKAGVNIFSPIVHSHHIASEGGLDPLNWAMFIEFDKPFVHLASGLIVLQLTEWANSSGIAGEIADFRAAKKPVVFMQPGWLPKQFISHPL